MFYYTYKITFIDGRYYFGKHQTKDLNDNYAGSGKKVIALQEAGLPYEKEILKFYNNTKDLNNAEKHLIGDLWYSDPMCLNLAIGGDGGWEELYPQGQFKGKKHSEETKRIIGEKNSVRQSGKGNSQYGTMWITDNKHNKKISKTSAIPTGWQKGRTIKG